MGYYILLKELLYSPNIARMIGKFDGNVPMSKGKPGLKAIINSFRRLGTKVTGIENTFLTTVLQ